MLVLRNTLRTANPSHDQLGVVERKGPFPIFGLRGDKKVKIRLSWIEITFISITNLKNQTEMGWVVTLIR